MKKVLGNFGVALVIGAMAIWGVGFGIKTMKPAPPNAKMFIDTRINTYLTPPCRENYTWEFAEFGPDGLVATTMADIRARQKAGGKLKPDDVCKNKGDGFFQTSALLPSILGFGKNRWTPEGDWNW
jgi:hypothetical protein